MPSAPTREAATHASHRTLHGRTQLGWVVTSGSAIDSRMISPELVFGLPVLADEGLRPSPGPYRWPSIADGTPSNSWSLYRGLGTPDRGRGGNDVGARRQRGLAEGLVPHLGENVAGHLIGRAPNRGGREQLVGLVEAALLDLDKHQLDDSDHGPAVAGGKATASNSTAASSSQFQRDQAQPRLAPPLCRDRPVRAPWPCCWYRTRAPA